MRSFVLQSAPPGETLPVYRQIAAQIRGQIEAGELDAGRVAGYLKLREELEISAREAAQRKKPPRHMRGRNQKKKR